MISATIIKDSINPRGDRLTTMVLEYPRMIHSELMTHRTFSRNAASSRAIPFSRMLEMALNHTAYPVKWGAEQKGMQSGEELSSKDRDQASFIWDQAMFAAVEHAKRLHEMHVHKSICNRLLEPFMHMKTIVSATEWQNFFKLRCHPDAEPTFQALAYAMKEAYESQEPTYRGWSEWHIPFADEELDIETALKVATARCARISYLTFEGEHSVEKDVELHDRLLTSGHWSPFEHCAVAEYAGPPRRKPSNFEGWTQYRKQFPSEDGRS